MNEIFSNGLVVPLGAFVVAIVAILSGMVSGIHSRRLKAEQRMALIARGVPLSEIEAYFAGDKVSEERVSSQWKRLHNSRTAAITLFGSGLGLVLFGIALAAIVQETGVLVVAAVGLIPLMLGVGFWVDFRMQKGDLERLSGVPKLEA